MSDKQTPKIGEGLAGPGRPKGLPNKTTALLKDAIIQAAEMAGDEGGMAAYLHKQAIENPGPFLALLGKVLPLQITGANDGPLQVNFHNHYAGSQHIEADPPLSITFAPRLGNGSQEARD
jgi:hypothetical protein